MPTSDIGNITPITNFCKRLHPKSVLDLGMGFGKYGVLLREYLDVEYGRLEPETWETTIVGVDGFTKYFSSLQRYVYSMVLDEDFSDVGNWPDYVDFDLVMLIDSLEHLERAKAVDLLAYLIANNKNVLVSVPAPEFYMEQGAVNGNELERHKTKFEPADFTMMGGKPIHRGVCMVYHFNRGN